MANCCSNCGSTELELVDDVDNGKNKFLRCACGKVFTLTYYCPSPDEVRDRAEQVLLDQASKMGGVDMHDVELMSLESWKGTAARVRALAS